MKSSSFLNKLHDCNITKTFIGVFSCLASNIQNFCCYFSSVKLFCVYKLFRQNIAHTDCQQLTAIRYIQGIFYDLKFFTTLKPEKNLTSISYSFSKFWKNLRKMYYQPIFDKNKTILRIKLRITEFFQKFEILVKFHYEMLISKNYEL